VPGREQARLRRRAAVFAALGDPTRLDVVALLAHGDPQSISRLTARGTLSRQAVAKHLRVLERAGLVRGTRAGRERRFALDATAVAEAREALDAISRQWDDALGRLKALVER
jgi:DNA-binding transcriptional ArsR family regulator